ncbi:hypothetical protein A5881_003904 [Enterococcus termitis]|nr:hypothetical protein A5881_003924 [Enterococcus termitis]
MIYIFIHFINAVTFFLQFCLVLSMTQINEKLSIFDSVFLLVTFLLMIFSLFMTGITLKELLIQKIEEEARKLAKKE